VKNAIVWICQNERVEKWLVVGLFGVQMNVIPVVRQKIIPKGHVQLTVCGFLLALNFLLTCLVAWDEMAANEKS